MNLEKIFPLCFLLFLSLLKTVSCRNQGCGLLILVTDEVMELFQNNELKVRNKVDKYIEKLNEIYQSTILKDPPNNNIYFFTEHLTVLRSYLPDCLNKQVNTFRYFGYFTNLFRSCWTLSSEWATPGTTAWFTSSSTETLAAWKVWAISMESANDTVT